MPLPGMPVMAAQAAAASGGNDAFTVLLLHCDGADASTTFTDVAAGGAGHAITVGGNAQVDTAQSKFGGASALFDGTGDSLSANDHADFEFGSGDFTIDYWVRFASVAGTQTIITKRDGGGNSMPFHILLNGGNVQLYMSSNGTTLDIANGRNVHAPSINTWYHHALTRSGTTFRFFVDGTQTDTFSSSSALIDNTAPLRIGIQSGGFGLNGWLDEVRLSKGVARWTANFTPPSSPYF